MNGIALPDKSGPTLTDLSAQLLKAENELLCAKMIDNTARMERESAEIKQRIADITAQINAHPDREGRANA